MKIPKKEHKIEKKFFRFSDNCVWIENGKFSFYRTRDLESAVNVLTNTPKIPNFNNVYMFQIFYSQSDEKKWSKCSE